MNPRFRVNQIMLKKQPKVDEFFSFPGQTLLMVLVKCW